MVIWRCAVMGMFLFLEREERRTITDSKDVVDDGARMSLIGQSMQEW